MKVNFEFEKPLDEIVVDLLRMENIIEEDQERIMKEIGKEIKKQVRNQLPKSNQSDEFYHMREDIKVKVSGKKAKTGVTGVTVHGGVWTGYKWHMLDDGTRNPDGTIHTKAIHFTSKALKAAEPQIESLINELERKVTEG